MVYTTLLGEVTYIFILFLFLVFFLFKTKKKKEIILLVLALITSGGLAYILKEIIRKERPSVEFTYKIIESGFSMPSGHALIATAFYGTIIYIINKRVKNKYIKYISSILLGILIMLICVSRIYIGVHWASDVLVGFILGVIIVLSLILLDNKVLNKKR